MRHFGIALLFGTVLLFANQTPQSIEEKNLQKQMEKEKKYAQEQKFYQGSDYDLESFEVDEDTLDSIPKQPGYNEDFNMDSVYD